MASQNRDIHMRIFLDSKDAIKANDALVASMKATAEQIKALEARKTAQGSNFSAADQAALDALYTQMKGLQLMSKQVLTTFREIGASVQDMEHLTARETRSIMTNIKRRMDGMRADTAADRQQMAELREQYEVLRQQLEKLTVEQRSFADAWKNIGRQTPEQLNKLVQQTLAFTQAQERGTKAIKDGLTYYIRFADAQAKMNGKATYTGALRAASLGNVEQLTALRDELELLQKNTKDPEILRRIGLSIDMLGDSIKRAPAAPLRDLNSVLNDIGKDTSFKGLSVLRQQLKATLDQLSDPSTTQRIKQNIDSVILQMNDPSITTSMQTRLTNLAQQFTSGKWQTNARAAFADVFRAIGDPAQMATAKKNLDQFFQDAIDPKRFEKVRTAVFDIMAGISDPNIRSQATQSVNNFVNAIASGNKAQIDQQKANIESFYYAIGDQTKVDEARGHMDAFYTAALDSTRVNEARRGFEKFFMSIADPAVKQQLQSISAAMEKGLLDPRLATKAQQEINSIINAITDPSIKRDVQASVNAVMSAIISPQQKAQAEASYRQLGVDLKNSMARSFDDISQDILKNKSATLSQLAEYKKALVDMRTNAGFAMDDAALQKNANAIANIEQKMINASRAIANGSLVASKDDMEAALKIIDERMTSITPKTKRQQEEITLMNAEYVKLKKAIDDWGKSLMTAAEAQTAYTTAQSLLQQGTNADADAVRASIEAMKQAQQVQGITVEKEQQYYEMEKKLTDLIHNRASATISLADAQGIANDLMNGLSINRTVNELEEAKKSLLAFKATLHTSDTAGLEDVNKQLRAIENELSRVKFDKAFVTKVATDPAKASLNDLKKAMEMLENEMKRIDRSSASNVQTYENYRSQLARLKKGYDNTSQSSRKLTASLDVADTWFNKATTKLLNYLGIFGGFYLMIQKVTDFFQANIKYSDSLTNIQKTTQLTSQAVELLADDLKHIDTRTSVDALNDLAYAAGKLGVKGVDNVLGFTRASDQLKIALGEQLGDASAAVEQIYKITNIMGDTKEFGLEESLLKLGSSINYITMNSQATAQPMVDFAKRLMGVSEQAGMSSSELMGWAGAVNALGQNVEMSATSLSKIMVQISSNSDKVAKALKLSNKETEEFKFNITTGRMSDALLTMLQKVNEAGGLSHLGTIAKDLGSEGQRVIQTIATLASGYETVEKMVRMSNQAFEEGTSVTNEYNLKNQNAASLWEKFKNKMQKIFISPENVELVQKFVSKLNQLPEAFERLYNQLRVFLPYLAKLFGTIISGIPVIVGLIEAMALRGAVRGIAVMSDWVLSLGGVTNMWKTAQEQLIKANVAVKGLTGRIRTLNLVLKSASLGNWITLIVGAVMAIKNFWDQAKTESRKWSLDTAQDIDHIKRKSEEVTVSLNSMLQKYREASGDEGARKKIIEELNNSYGQYIDNLITEKSSYIEIAKAIESANKQLRIKALIEGKQQRMNDIENSFIEKQGTAEDDLRSAIIKELFPVAASVEDATADAATAMKAIQFLLSDENISKFLRPVRDNQGRVTGYEAWSSLSMSGKQSPARNAAEQLLIDAFDGIDVTKKINGTVYDNLSDLFVELANVYAQKNLQKSIQGAVYDANARAEAEREVTVVDENGKKQVITAKQETERNTNEAWEVIGNSVLKSGADFGYYKNGDPEVKAGMAMAGEVKGYVTKQQEQPWVNLKDNLSKMGAEGNRRRVEIEDALSRFIEDSGNEMALLQTYLTGATTEGKMSAEDKRYYELKVRRNNAQRELEILSLGQLENKGEGSGSVKDGKEQYNNLIKKIQDFYKLQEKAYQQQRADGLITQTQLDQGLKVNNRNLHETLAAARKMIVGDSKPSAYDSAMRAMASRNIAGKEGNDAAQRVLSVSANDARNIGNLIRSKEPDNSFISGIRYDSDNDILEIKKYVNAVMDEVHKVLLTHNPIAQMSEQYQAEFEKMGIMFADLSGKTRQEMQHNAEVAMANLRELGKEATNYDIQTEEGYDAFLKAARSKFSELDKLVKNASADQMPVIRQRVLALYYKSYDYATAVEDAIEKDAKQKAKQWANLYQRRPEYKEDEQQLKTMERYLKYMERMQAFGYSSRTSLKQSVANAQQELDMQNSIWQNNIDRMKAEYEAAQAAVRNEDDGAADRLAAAERELALIQEKPTDVLNAEQKVTDAVGKMRDANREWVASMVKGFDTFMDGFVPFRSWYEDKGSLVDNMFGTKDERQKAFGQFMDDLKKTIRNEAMERVRAAITESAEKARRDKEAKEAEAKAAAERQQKNQAELTSDAELYDGKLKLQQTYTESSLDLFADYFGNLEQLKEESLGRITDDVLEAMGMGDSMMDDLKSQYGFDANERQREDEEADRELLMAGGDASISADAARIQANRNKLRAINSNDEMYDYLRSILGKALADSGFVSDEEFEQYLDVLTGQAVIESRGRQGGFSGLARNYNNFSGMTVGTAGGKATGSKTLTNSKGEDRNTYAVFANPEDWAEAFVQYLNRKFNAFGFGPDEYPYRLQGNVRGNYATAPGYAAALKTGSKKANAQADGAYEHESVTPEQAAANRQAARLAGRASRSATPSASSTAPASSEPSSPLPLYMSNGMIRQRMSESAKAVNHSIAMDTGDHPTTKGAALRYYDYEALLGQDFVSLEDLQAKFAEIEARYKSVYVYVDKANALWEKGVREQGYPEKVQEMNEHPQYSEDEYIAFLNDQHKQRESAEMAQEQERTFANREFTDSVEDLAVWIQAFISRNGISPVSSTETVTTNGTETEAHETKGGNIQPLYEKYRGKNPSRTYNNSAAGSEETTELGNEPYYNRVDTTTLVGGSVRPEEYDGETSEELGLTPIPVIPVNEDGEPLATEQSVEGEQLNANNPIAPSVNAPRSAGDIASTSAISATTNSVSSAASKSVNDGSLGGSILSAGLSSAVNAAGQYASEKAQQKANKKRVKDAQQTANQEVSITKKAEKKKTEAVNDSTTEQGVLQKTLTATREQLSNAAANVDISNSQKATAQKKSDDVSESSTSMFGNLGKALTAAWAEGGPYLGAVLAAVVSAAVGGIITMVMNMMGSSSSTSTSTKTKVVSGMLTYDRGNVQSFGRVRTLASGDNFPIMGDDGKIYYVNQSNGELQTGMVNGPTLANINGQPSIVGELGPEMVIGRETTRAMQMYRPDLIQQIALFDKNRSRGYAKTYDAGTPLDSNLSTLNSSFTVEDFQQMRDVMQQMTLVNQQLTAQLAKGIKASVNKYGAGGLLDEVASGFVEQRRNGSSKNVTRLFG